MPRHLAGRRQGLQLGGALENPKVGGQLYEHPPPALSRRMSAARTPKRERRYLFSVAPMMEWTDRHCRFFHRLLTRRALLYTEMLTTGAVLHGDRARLLRFDAAEHPAAL